MRSRPLAVSLRGQGYSDRDEAFRERLITAADDLSTGLLQAIIGLNDAYEACLKHGYLNAQNQLTIRHPDTGKVPSEIDEALARSRALIGEARARSARVSLLFGPVSAPDRSATLALMHLDSALSALDDWPVPDLDKWSKERAGAKTYLSDFNRWALRDARGEPWFRWGVALSIWHRWRRWRARRKEEPPGLRGFRSG